MVAPWANKWPKCCGLDKPTPKIRIRKGIKIRIQHGSWILNGFRGSLAFLVGLEAPKDLEARRFWNIQRFSTEQIKMLVERFKDRVKAETEVKKRPGREQPSLYAVLGSVWLNAHSVGLHFFLHVWDPPRGRLSPTLGWFWFRSASQLNSWSLTAGEKSLLTRRCRQPIPSEHPHVAALFSGSGSRSDWIQGSAQQRSWSPEVRDDLIVCWGSQLEAKGISHARIPTSEVLSLLRPLSSVLGSYGSWDKPSPHLSLDLPYSILYIGLCRL